jgi:hypothetical protein
VLDSLLPLLHAAAATAAALAAGAAKTCLSYSLARSPLRLPGSADIYIHICLIIFKQDYFSILKCCLPSAVVQFQGPLGLEHLRRSLDFSQDAGLTDVRDFLSICNIYI